MKQGGSEITIESILPVLLDVQALGVGSFEFSNKAFTIKVSFVEKQKPNVVSNIDVDLSGLRPETLDDYVYKNSKEMEDIFSMPQTDQV